jgi:hypothetical protein
MAKQTSPCEQAEAHQFDFWLGKWDLTWADGGKGTNQITRILDCCVIQENFDGTPTMDLKGVSVSVFDVRSGQWKQTWVDSSGSYLDFVGGMEDGKMILSRKMLLDGKPIKQRMVFYNIAENELDWNWERSNDNGATWTVLWHIHYRRKYPS